MAQNADNGGLQQLQMSQQAGFARGASKGSEATAPSAAQLKGASSQQRDNASKAIVKGAMRDADSQATAAASRDAATDAHLDVRDGDDGGTARPHTASAAPSTSSRPTLKGLTSTLKTSGNARATTGTQPDPSAATRSGASVGTKPASSSLRNRPRASTLISPPAKLDDPDPVDEAEHGDNAQQLQRSNGNHARRASEAQPSLRQLGNGGTHAATSMSARLHARFDSLPDSSAVSSARTAPQTRLPASTRPVRSASGSASAHWRMPLQEIETKATAPVSSISSTNSKSAGISASPSLISNRFSVLDEEEAEDTPLPLRCRSDSGSSTAAAEPASTHTATSNQAVGSTPNRPKSNTIIGLAPQLWRAQRAAAEAAAEAGSSAVVSLLSGSQATRVPRDSAPSTTHIAGPTKVASKTDEADDSDISYSSSDTIFAPVLPAPGSMLRSSRQREPISRRMTVGSDTRSRLSNVLATAPAETQPGLLASMSSTTLFHFDIDDIVNDGAEKENEGLAAALAEARLNELSDADSPPSTPKPLDLAGTRSFGSTAAAAAAHGTGECELCGILTTTLTLLLPCRHSACAACCSSGINQVSTSPPRSHVCAACRAPVESISLSKKNVGFGMVATVAAAAVIPDEAGVGLPSKGRTLTSSSSSSSATAAGSGLAFATGVEDEALMSFANGSDLLLSANDEVGTGTIKMPAAGSEVPTLNVDASSFDPSARFGAGIAPTTFPQLRSPYGGPAARLAPAPPSFYGGMPVPSFSFDHPMAGGQMLSGAFGAKTSAVLPSLTMPIAPLQPLAGQPSPGSEVAPSGPQVSFLPGCETPFDGPNAGLPVAQREGDQTGDDNAAFGIQAQPAVVRIDNIPWTVGFDDITKWLPDPIYTLAPKNVYAQAVHIPIDLQNGKTSNACYLVCRDRKAAQRIVRARTNTKLCGRPVTLILSTFHELLDEIFTTRNLSASLDEDRAVYFTEQQLGRLLLLLKEGGGQLKDGGKPIEFASSLMALVPQRLAADQKEMLYNAVNEMVRHCLAIVGQAPGIRPALDRLLLSCSMCAAFSPEQKMTVIETARAALSALMLSDNAHKRSSPRARKAASVPHAGMTSRASLPYGNGLLPPVEMSPYAQQLYTSPRPPHHGGPPLPEAGSASSQAPLAQPNLGMGFPTPPYYEVVPYATPPYGVNDVKMATGPPPSAARDQRFASGMRMASPHAGHADMAGGEAQPGFDAMVNGNPHLGPQRFTPECSPYTEVNVALPFARTGGQSLHSFTPNLASNGIRPNMLPFTTPEHHVMIPGGPSPGMARAGMYGGPISPGLAPGYVLPMPGPGQGSGPPSYPLAFGAPPPGHSHGPTHQTFGHIAAGANPTGYVATAIPAPLDEGGTSNELGLYSMGNGSGSQMRPGPGMHGITPLATSGTSDRLQPGAAPFNPSMARQMQPTAPMLAPHASAAQSNAETDTLKDDVTASLQKLMSDEASLESLKAGPSGSDPSGEPTQLPALTTLASSAPQLKHDQVDFDRLVEAVAQAIQKKKTTGPSTSTAATASVPATTS